MANSHRQWLHARVAPALALTVATAWSLIATRAAWAEQSAEIRLSRYTTSTAAPDPAQLDPLEVIVQVTFPRAGVSTVGDAVKYLLLRTGYRLAAQKDADPAATAILSLPLPEVHRQLGPFSARTALSVLIGSPFSVSVDPAQRLISYRSSTPGTQGGTPAAIEVLSADRTANGRARSN